MALVLPQPHKFVRPPCFCYRLKEIEVRIWDGLQWRNNCSKYREMCSVGSEVERNTQHGVQLELP